MNETSMPVNIVCMNPQLPMDKTEREGEEREHKSAVYSTSMRHLVVVGVHGSYFPPTLLYDGATFLPLKQHLQVTLIKSVHYISVFFTQKSFTLRMSPVFLNPPGT